MLLTETDGTKQSVLLETVSVSITIVDFKEFDFTCFVFQFNVLAKDGGGRAGANTAAVTITVVRSTAPDFLNTINYVVTIDQNRNPGDQVFQTSIHDGDVVSILY